MGFHPLRLRMRIPQKLERDALSLELFMNKDEIGLGPRGGGWRLTLREQPLQA